MFLVSFSGVKFFREQVHELLMEMNTPDFFDDKHYFATFLHPKHRDMSKSIDLHYLLNNDESFLFLSVRINFGY